MALEAPCANCGAALQGAFCHACGQRRFPGRLTLRGLLGDLTRRVFNVEQGFFATFLAMTVRPGRVIGEYIRGRQRRYVNPITYLLLAAALALLTYGLFRQELLSAGLREASQEQARLLLLNAAQAELYLEIQLRLMRQLNAGGLLSCIPFALLLRLFFWGGPINLAEAGVFALYVSGQLYFMGALVDLLVPWLGLQGQIWVVLGLLAVLSGQAAWGLFERRLSGALRAMAAALLAYLAFGTVLAATLVTYVKLVA